MEIERKWMVSGWPDGLPQLETWQMDQGYLCVRPTVRIRREALQGGRTALVLCFKGAGTLAREEIETEIDAGLFAKLEHLIGKPLIEGRIAQQLGDDLGVDVIDRIEDALAAIALRVAVPQLHRLEGPGGSP